MDNKDTHYFIDNQKVSPESFYNEAGNQLYLYGTQFFQGSITPQGFSYVLRKPFYDEKVVKRGFFKSFEKDKGKKFDFDFALVRHSNNWSMGSLILDIYYFSIAVLGYRFSMGYRAVIYPPVAGHK